MKVKRGIGVLIQLLKNFVSCHVVFLEHISSFSISSSIHDLTRYDLLRIDPFYEDSNNLSSQVPSATYTPSHHIQRVVTNSSACTDTLLFGTPKAPSSPIVPQASSEIVDPPLRRSTHVCKSIKSPYFDNSCYSSSFTSCLASIHCFSEPFSYKEAILDPRWQQDMDEELSALHKYWGFGSSTSW